MVGFVIGAVLFSFFLGFLLGVFVTLLPVSGNYSSIPSPLLHKKSTNGR